MTRTTITVPNLVIAEAKALHVNISRFCQQSLAREVSRLKAERWYKENKAAIDAYNEYVRQRGVALEKQRVW